MNISKNIKYSELTMKILYDQREQRGAHLGYVGTFLKQFEEVVAACLDRGIKIVTNAGGLNPAGFSSPQTTGRPTTRTG